MGGVIVEEEDMETMVVIITLVDITQKEVKVGLVTIPREVSFNGIILPCVSDMATEYREISIASWGKLHETKTFRLNQMENSFIKEACWCLSYRGVSILWMCSFDYMFLCYVMSDGKMLKL